MSIETDYFVADTKLDSDGDIALELKKEWATRKDAIELIEHFMTVFDIGFDELPFYVESEQ